MLFTIFKYHFSFRDIKVFKPCELPTCMVSDVVINKVISATLNQKYMDLLGSKIPLEVVHIMNLTFL